LYQLLSLIVPSGIVDTPVVSDDVQEALAFDQSEPDAVDKGKGNPADPSPAPSISHGVGPGGTTLSTLVQLLSVSDSSGGTENPAILDRIREFIESSIHPFDPDTVSESTSNVSSGIVDTPVISDDVQEALTFDQSEPDTEDEGEANPADPSPVPSISHSTESDGAALSRLFQLLSVSVSSGGADNFPALHHVREPTTSSIHPLDPDAASESIWNRKSTFATLNATLHEVVESPVAYPPLKSIASCLCAVLDNCQVQPSSCAFNPWCLQPHQQTKVNVKAVKSLVSRIRPLSKSLCAPIPAGDVNERGRENKLKW
jgi:hypothetical protein